MWSEIFRGERAAYTVVLTLGVGLAVLLLRMTARRDPVPAAGD